jgi:sulfate permease, SulP family
VIEPNTTSKISGTQAKKRLWLWRFFSENSGFLLHPARILETYQRKALTADMTAGLTVAVVLLPQAIAYAMIAELPPSTGLYAAIVGAVVGALWGSSHHLQTGPTNATSLLVLASLLTVAQPGTPEFLVAAGYMAILVGLIKLVMGLLRMGVLVNFVADSVVLGFTSGAALLIAANQMRHLLRIDLPSTPEFFEMIRLLVRSLGDFHGLSLAVGLGSMVVIVLVKWLLPKWPAPLIGMVVAAVVTAAFNLDERGVEVLGAIPRSLPPLATLPLLSGDLLWKISAGALAASAIGLVEAVSSARSIAAKSGQRLDSNQEFVGQGMASIFSGFFSGFPVSGSFTRSAVNYGSGGRTPISSVFSGLFVMVAMLLMAPLVGFLPRTALAGVLLVTAWGMIDRAEIRRIFRSSFGDSSVLVATFLATVLAPLEFAVLAGMLVSFGRYLIKTSSPGVNAVVPDENFRHFINAADHTVCPQLGVVSVEGSLYFGAVHHVEEAIQANRLANPRQIYLLLRMHLVDHCDVSGIHMLESVVKSYRKRGGDVYLDGVRPAAMHMINLYGFDRMIGSENILLSDDAIGHLFHKVLNPGFCVYECSRRVFAECQALPKDSHGDHLPDSGALMKILALSDPDHVAEHSIDTLTPREVKARLDDPDDNSLFVDVGEPGEFTNWHITEARSIPMRRLAVDGASLPMDRPIILISRIGRRSNLGALIMQDLGHEQVFVLKGGMLAWEAAGFPIAVE